MRRIRDNYAVVPKLSEFGWRWFVDASGLWWMCWAQPSYVDMYGPFEKANEVKFEEGNDHLGS